MRTIDSLLNEYGASHRNPTNKLIHWLCVPAIVWSVFALLWSIPFPGNLTLAGLPLNWAVVVFLLSLLFYLRVSPRLAVGVIIFSLLALGLCHAMDANLRTPLWLIGLAVFVVAWIVQFIGHHIEGKRPSFFTDLKFLLVGPAWLTAHLYRRFGIRY